MIPSDTAIAREMQEYGLDAMQATRRIQARVTLQSMPRSVRLYDRAVDQLETDHTAHKAAIATTGDNLADLAVRLRAINPKLFDAVRAEMVGEGM